MDFFVCPMEGSIEAKNDELKSYWNQFSKLYGDFLEFYNLPLGVQIWHMLYKPRFVTFVEAGCGSGHFLNYLIKDISFGCSIFASDLSDKMLTKATERNQDIIREKKKKMQIEVFYQNCPNEKLKGLTSAGVDVYVSNLTLHLVNEPEKMLKEAKRVLRIGGRIGLSVLGDYNKCTSIKEITEIIRKHQPEGKKWGSSAKEKPFQFTRESLIELVQSVGFKVEFCWESWVPHPLYSNDQYDINTKLPGNLKKIRTYDEETQQKIMDEYHEMAAKRREEYTPMGIEGIMLVGTKVSE